jgi:hypothetical protein
MMRGEAAEEDDEGEEEGADEECDSRGYGDAHSEGMVDADRQTGFDFGTYRDRPHCGRCDPVL